MDQQEKEDTAVRPEPLLTLKEAALALGLPYFKMQRAARLGHLPTYSLLNSRRLVRISEVIACIERSRSGGER